MAQVSIGAVNYDSFATVAQADTFNGGDILRAPIWAALVADTKVRALVTATRKLLRLSWADGLPSLAATPAPVIEACSALAADIAATPALAASASTASNIKRTKAGSVEVEFFKQSASDILPIPQDVYELLAASGLLAAPIGGQPYVSDDNEISRFDQNPFDNGVEPEWVM
jgi:hypothetical protein